MASNRVSSDTKDLVNKTYAYVEGSRELRHIAAAIAYLYRTSLYVSCPGAAPRSAITRDARAHVVMRYNSPRGMKPLNSMLRHAYNFFYDIQRMMNWDDYEARNNARNVVFFRARSICAAISEAFGILVEADMSRTKDGTASRLFRMITDYIGALPNTLAAQRAADAAEAEERRKAAEARAKVDAERAAAAKADENKTRANANARARAAGFASAANVW
jgi:hypothetical protein